MTAITNRPFARLIASLLLFGASAVEASAKSLPPPPKIDSCLVGTWRTDFVTSLGAFPDPHAGAGVVLTVKADGNEAIDYSAMAPLKQPVGPLQSGSHFFRGTAAALFATPSPGHASLVAMLQSNVSATYPDAHANPVTKPLGKTLGPGGLGNDPRGSYRCTNASLEIKNTVYTFRYALVGRGGPMAMAGGGSAGGAGSGAGPTPGPFNPLPGGQFCVKNAGAVADTSPCTGPVKPAGFMITARLKKAIPVPLDTVKFLASTLTTTSGVIGAIAGTGTTVNSDYTITAPPELCVNTGTKYSVRVFAGGVSYGDIGIFWPDCR